MNKSLVAGLCATVAVLASGAAFAAQPKAQTYAKPEVPPVYISAAAAQASCPTDHVLWVNWETDTAHSPASKWYGRTTVGAYACAQQSSALGYHLED